MKDRPLITLKKITARLRERRILPDTSWEIRDGQNWAVIGPNGAGKSTLVGILTGDVPCIQGSVSVRFRNTDHAVGFVSFELHERLVSGDEEKDHDRWFCGDVDAVETARETILSGNGSRPLPRDFNRVIGLLGIRRLLDRGIRFLSTGEIRKVLIARSLVKSPRLLIFDEPFGGLDASARKKLAALIGRLMKDGVQIVLVTNRREEILPGITHVIGVREGRVVFQGQREEILKLDLATRLFRTERSQPDRVGGGPPDTASPRRGMRSGTLVEMKNITVQYGDVTVLHGVNWTVKKGENWAVVGPNGSGKTTLLNLITGDNLQAYANDIRLFGRRRGSGESIWDIRKRIGMVSSELQVRYRKELTAFDVVASGLFDSIGIYRHLSAYERRRVREAMKRLGLETLASRSFRRLSYGERRMVLIARAMVKSPLLLILDEPCQGLDHANRERVLELIDAIGRSGSMGLVYVTHHLQEFPSSITRVLRLGKNGATVCERSLTAE